MAKKITQEQMLEAIKNSQGLISKIQRNLAKITGETWSWETVEKYTHNWESCENAIKAEKEAMLDLAENNVFKEMAKGDIGTSKWFLKMKGKDRGYVETQELRTVNADPLNINLQGELFSDTELAESSTVDVPEYEENESEEE